MATFEPSLPLGAKIKPPEGCTCGSNIMCRLHFCESDYVIGSQVTFNPYTIHRYGLPGNSMSGEEIFTLRRTFWDNRGVFMLSTTDGSSYHVGWMRPWGFMTYVKRALEEKHGRNPNPIR